MGLVEAHAMARRTSESARERWRDRLARWRGSDLSISEFCFREGVSPPSFYQWRKRLQRRPNLRRGRTASSPVLVPVEVVGSTTESSRLSKGDGEGALVEVVM